jgi:uncharacterized protein YwgA
MLSQLNKNILVALVRRVQAKGLDLGKIQFQKLIYFLQEKGVTLDYDYEIHHYGPYCFELASDLDLLNALEILEVSPDQKGYGYHISGGRLADSFSEKNDQLIAEYNTSLEFVIDNFAGWDPGEIELKATIHYVNKIMKNKDPETSREDVLRVTGELKPKFSQEYVARCYDELNTILPL